MYIAGLLRNKFVLALLMLLVCISPLVFLVLGRVNSLAGTTAEVPQYTFPSKNDLQAWQEDIPPSPVEVYTSPEQAYYAGRIEEAIQMLSGPEPEHGPQRLVLYWELGENAKAAQLLEELTTDSSLAAVERDELLLELFITRVLSGSYEQAAAMQGVMEAAAGRMNRRPRAEFYFYNAYVYHEMGDLYRAEEYYRQSLDINRWRAMAWYRLGTILLDSNPAEAQEAFQNCWNQNRAFNAAILPLAQLLAGQGEWLQARNLLITANDRILEDGDAAAAANAGAYATAVRETLAAVIRQIGPPGDGLHFIRRLITEEAPKVTPAPITPGEGVMRIGLAVDRPLISVKAGGNFTVLDAETRQALYNGQAGDQFWVQWNGEDSLSIHGENNQVLLTSSAPVVYVLNDNHDTSIVAGVVSAMLWLNRIYRGRLEFRPEPAGITVISIVNMGDYLYGVVPAEMPPAWPREVLRAQAIAARSYAMAYRGTYADRGFDIWNTALSQTYLGVAFEHLSTTAAVDDTRGIILEGETGEPLAAYYSANHGGHSEDSRVIYGYEAYMQAVQDTMLPLRTFPLPPDALFRWINDAPSTYSNVPGFFFGDTYRWERWVSPDEIRRRLIQDSRVARDPGEIQKIISRGRGILGRIVELEVQGSERNVFVRGNAIWGVLGGLRSNLFTVRYKRDRDGGIQYFVFTGAGYGHGMGMDQHAAAAMAHGGMSAEDILIHFYPRASLRRL